tara:strand:- start:2869 stop:4062 length:1194 start_codon:yes stop_codon:yes gene_type:complete
MKILLLENIHKVAKDLLEQEGYDVDLQPGALNEGDLIEAAKSYDCIGLRSKTQVTEKVLHANPHLFAVGAFCIGTNQIDTSSAARLGIPVFNAPYANTRSVAELVICEIIGLARKVFHLNRQAHKGQWQKSAKSSYEVRGKTLGIVGYGHIGSQVSVLAEAMGMNVIYYDIIKKLPLGNSTPVESLECLLAESDFVSLHVPATELTTNMIQTKELNLMRKGAYLINASRGSVVDIDALNTAISEKHLAGAAIDVFPVEPKNNEEIFQSPLQEQENVILTPHIGGSTEEAQENIGREVADAFIRFLKMGSTQASVNFPQADLPLKSGVTRMLNVHKNVPGVLSEINKIVASTGVNISSQYLATNTEIGYLIMDIENEGAKGFSDEIAKLPNSIKTRLL